MLWRFIHENLDVIVPILVPIAFNIVNIILKWERNVLNPNLLGADMSVGSCSLFAGTLLGCLLHDLLTDRREILTAAVIAGLLLFGWWLSLSLGSKSFPLARGSKAQPLLAFILGALSLYNGSRCAWHLLQEINR